MATSSRSREPMFKEVASIQFGMFTEEEVGSRGSSQSGGSNTHSTSARGSCTSDISYIWCK